MITAIDHTIPNGNPRRIDLTSRRHARTNQAISNAYNELWDKVWWVRHHAHGGPEVGRAAAREVELHYGLDGLELTDFEWGLLSGRMSALAWMLGMNWDESLDT